VSKDAIFEQTGLAVGVQDAHFSVHAGEIFVVMGLSGSGKSTLLRMINRLVEPTTGSLQIEGRDITAMSAAELIALRRSKMAMVFQSFALLPHLTVWQNAAFGLEIAGVDKKARRERAMKALHEVGLDAYAERYPDELSGGMQQRVGLARALAPDPALLLMDEAFSALDPLIRSEMQGQLLRLQQEKSRTVVFISHDLDEAMRIGDRIAIMESGRILQIGTPDEILRYPADAHVRSFFGGVDISNVYTARDVARWAHRVVLTYRADRGLRIALQRLRERDQDFAFIRGPAGRWQGVVSVDSLLRTLRNGSERLEDAFLDIEPLDANTPFDQVVRRVAHSPCPVPVVDRQGHYVGAVSKTTVLEALERRSAA
jgi:glycine betaine/proline transport system ATP-binding protein